MVYDRIVSKDLSLKNPLAAVLLSITLLTGCDQEKYPPFASDSRSPDFSKQCEKIIRQRASAHASQKFLLVNYYRIYQKVAYPLPVRQIQNPEFRVEGIPGYPWEIWMTWELEERINNLGWAGQWYDNREYRLLVQRDLKALTGWPAYDFWERPHLAGAHAVRIMVTAYRNWAWLDAGLKEAIKQACARAVDLQAGWLKNRLQLETVEQILNAPRRGSFTHNIPTIATIGLCMAARLSGHPLKEDLERHTQALVMAQFELRKMGLTEAISYDGYILDFIADWLCDSPSEIQQEVLGHHQLGRMLEQSVVLAAPGHLLNIAPFNDVEAREMPFHASAHAKFARMKARPRSEWFLSRCPLDWLRSDALAALHDLQVTGSAQAPVPGAIEGLYALVLRSGWDDGDLAVAISATNTPPGHIQKDNGSVVIGTHGAWLIDDPGYQQYVPGQEREFTLGSTAHNFPLVNGHAQKINSVKRLLCTENDSFLHAVVDITGGYDRSLNLELVRRHAWMLDNSIVVIADRISGPEVRNCEYYWHANPQAALWLQGDACLICLGPANLWVQCANAPIQGAEIRRLPGTRGQITIHAELETGEDSCLWWLFNLGERPNKYELKNGGLAMEIAGRRLEVDGLP